MPRDDPARRLSRQPPDISADIIHDDPVAQDLVQGGGEREVGSDIREVLDEVVGHRVPSGREGLQGERNGHEMRWEEGVEDRYEVCGDVKKEGSGGLVYELESRSRRASVLPRREDKLSLAVGGVLRGDRCRDHHLGSGRDEIPALIHVHHILRVKLSNSSWAHPDESRPILQLGKGDEGSRRELRECILGKQA